MPSTLAPTRLIFSLSKQFKRGYPQILQPFGWHMQLSETLGFLAEHQCQDSLLLRKGAHETSWESWTWARLGNKTTLRVKIMETSSNPLPVALFFLSPHTKTIELEYCSPTRSGVYAILIGVSMMRSGRFDEGTYCLEELLLREPLTDCIALSFRTRKLLIIATNTWIEIEVESRDENHQYRGRSKNMWLVSETSNHVPPPHCTIIVVLYFVWCCLMALLLLLYLPRSSDLELIVNIIVAHALYSNSRNWMRMNLVRGPFFFF